MYKPTNRNSLQPHRCLKALRTTCGITQQQLAQLIGVSTSTITSIEVGRLAMTLSIAQRISAQTGVAARAILRPEGKPVHISGREMSRNRYNDTRGLFLKNRRSSPEEDRVVAILAAEDFRTAAATLRLLLGVAYRKRTSHALLSSFHAWATQSAAEFGLMGRIREIAPRSNGARTALRVFSCYT